MIIVVLKKEIWPITNPEKDKKEKSTYLNWRKGEKKVQHIAVMWRKGSVKKKLLNIFQAKF